MTDVDPSPYAVDVPNAADARLKLEVTRDLLLGESVKVEVWASEHPSIREARQSLTKQRSVARWTLAAIAVAVAFLMLLAYLIPGAAGAVGFSALAVATVGYLIFQVGTTSLDPSLDHLSVPRREALYEWARERGIHIFSLRATGVDADLIGGWDGEDEFHVRTDRLHPDLPDTQELLDEWAKADAA